MPTVPTSMQFPQAELTNLAPLLGPRLRSSQGDPTPGQPRGKDLQGSGCWEFHRVEAVQRTREGRMKMGAREEAEGAWYESHSCVSMMSS